MSTGSRAAQLGDRVAAVCRTCPAVGARSVLGVWNTDYDVDSEQVGRKSLEGMFVLEARQNWVMVTELIPFFTRQDVTGK